MFEKRSDLAIEARESFPSDDVEINGVILEQKTLLDGLLSMSDVKIETKEGADAMKKPIGSYITLEFDKASDYIYGDEREQFEQTICEAVKNVLKRLTKCDSSNKPYICMIVGLGNRLATPDALGPLVIENINVNRHLLAEYGDKSSEAFVCAIAPGVMGQTGMETLEIIKGLINQISPDYIFAIDSLATKNTLRLCRTIQITDTGIFPGAGIGNNRQKLDKETVGTPVIAIGVPTVIDASTMISECVEETLGQNGLNSEEIQFFLEDISANSMKDLFVTPKDIDAQMAWLSRLISSAINSFCTPQ